MVDKKARAFGLWEVKSLAGITQLSKQWSWSVPLWSLSSPPPCIRDALMLLRVPSPLQVPQVDTSRVFGGQGTSLRWLKGFEKNDDLDSVFLLLVEMLLALGKAKSRKDHWVSITSTCFKRGPSGFKNVFLVCDTVSEFQLTKSPSAGGGQTVPGWPVQAGLQAEALHHQAYFSLYCMIFFFQFILHDLLLLHSSSSVESLPPSLFILHCAHITRILLQCRF